MCDEQKELPVPSSPYIPGAPAPRAPDLREPVEPRPPLPPKEDQRQPEVRTVAGAEPATDSHGRAQQGEFLTTAIGTHLYKTEKITHFDHEHIAERVMHTGGAAAHGNFVANGSAESICKAALFAKGTQTPTFVRFSTVLGSRGSADTVRDTRGFATKFYTEEGVFDLVGNNIPVFLHWGLPESTTRHSGW